MNTILRRATKILILCTLRLMFVSQNYCHDLGVLNTIFSIFHRYLTGIFLPFLAICCRFFHALLLHLLPQYCALLLANGNNASPHSAQIRVPVGSGCPSRCAFSNRMCLFSATSYFVCAFRHRYSALRQASEQNRLDLRHVKTIVPQQSHTISWCRFLRNCEGTGLPPHPYIPHNTRRSIYN